MQPLERGKETADAAIQAAKRRLAKEHNLDPQDLEFIGTWNTGFQGHELLDSICDDTAWNRLKKLLREKSIDLSYSAVKAAAGYFLNRTLS